MDASTSHLKPLLDLLIHDGSWQQAGQLLSAIKQIDYADPTVFEILMEKGGFDLTTLPDVSRCTLWIYSLQQHPNEQLHGLLHNLTGGNIHELKRVVPSPTLLIPAGRRHYIDFLNHHILHNESDGTEVGMELSGRLVDMFEHYCKQDFPADPIPVLKDIIGIMGEGGSTTALRSLLILYCNIPHAPKSAQHRVLTQDEHERLGELITAFAKLGADIHTPFDLKLKDEKQSKRNPAPVFTNALTQILWLRHHGKSGPNGGQGEYDPIINALISAGADWEDTMRSPECNEIMKKTLHQHPIVRKAGLEKQIAKTQRGQRKTPARSRGRL